MGRNRIWSRKIVLMPRTWSVRIFAQNTPCLVASIVTLRIWVEIDPGHDFWRKLVKVCQADLDLKDWVRFHGDIWNESELKIKFLDKYHFNLQKSKFALPSGSNISMNNALIFLIRVSLTNLGKFPSIIMSCICFYSNSKCHNLSNKTSCFFSENPDTPGSWHQNYFF